MHRFYAMHLAPTLFGEWAVVTEWGRIGSPGTVRHRVFATEALARTALLQRAHAKLGRGYRLTSQAWEVVA
jgi:predicted DNA-binding WGR domain protein